MCLMVREDWDFHWTRLANDSDLNHSVRNQFDLSVYSAFDEFVNCSKYSACCGQLVFPRLCRFPGRFVGQLVAFQLERCGVQHDPGVQAVALQKTNTELICTAD